MKLKRYWISDGAEVTGPFTPGELRDLHATGHLDEGHDACEEGTEGWMRALDLLQDLRIVAPPVPPPVKLPKIKRATGGALAFVLLLLGVVCLLACNVVTIIIGIGCVIGAVCVERSHYMCSGCGNRVEQTSRMCPTCRCELQ